MQNTDWLYVQISQARVQLPLDAKRAVSSARLTVRSLLLARSALADICLQDVLPLVLSLSVFSYLYLSLTGFVTFSFFVARDTGNESEDSKEVWCTETRHEAPQSSEVPSYYNCWLHRRLQWQDCAGESIVLSAPGVASTSIVSSVSKVAGRSTVLKRHHRLWTYRPPTIYGHIFLAGEEIEAKIKYYDTIQAELGSTLATQKKFQAMLIRSHICSCYKRRWKFVLFRNILSGLLSCTVCKLWLEADLTAHESTKLELATTKFDSVCLVRGSIASSWTYRKKTQWVSNTTFAQ